jgi:carbon-monoxide dehydrogenase medium subunit
VHADPAADPPAAVLVLEAEMVARGSKGERTIRAAEFFRGMLASAVAPDEILMEIRVPVPPRGVGTAYLKFPHPASGFAVVGVAAWVSPPDVAPVDARVAITGVGPMAYRAAGVEASLRNGGLDDAAIAQAASRAVEAVDVNEDLFANADYRSHLARVLTRRALRAARERAGER